MYDSNYMIFWKKQNYGGRKRISGCQRLQGWGNGQVGTEFLGQWKYPFGCYESVDIIIHFSKFYIMYNTNTKSKP